MSNSWKGGVAKAGANVLLGFLSDAWKAIVVGAISIVLSGWLTIHVFFAAYPTITQSDIELVRGKIERAGIVSIGSSERLAIGWSITASLFTLMLDIQVISKRIPWLDWFLQCR